MQRRKKRIVFLIYLVALASSSCTSCVSDDFDDGELPGSSEGGFECLSDYCDEQVECLVATQLEREDGTNGIRVENRCEETLRFDSSLEEALGTSYSIRRVDGEVVQKRADVSSSPDSPEVGELPPGFSRDVYFDDQFFDFGTYDVVCVDGLAQKSSEPVEPEDILISVITPHPILPSGPAQYEVPSEHRVMTPGCAPEWKEFAENGPFIRSTIEVPFR